MESQVHDLNAVIDKLTKEVEKEQRKRSDAVKDRDSISLKHQKLQEVFDKLEIEDPDQFKLEFENLKKDILKLKKQLADKTKAVVAKENKLK